MTRFLLVLIVLVATASSLFAIQDPKGFQDAKHSLLTAVYQHKHRAMRSVEISRSNNGDFALRARINGVAAPMVIDTGATSVVLTYETAKAAGLPVELANQQPLLYKFLLNKWYFDELYDFIFVRPAKWIGRFLWKVGDGKIIDGLGPDGVSARVLDVTRNAVKLQTGYLYHYAFAMLIGVAGFITWFMFGVGG